jgi:pyrroline-5-carboxylate reductase
MKKNKILFIGAGNMGSAIIKGLNQKNSLVHEIYFYEPNECVRNTISTKLNANAISEINEEIANFDTVIFAVKPQVFRVFPTDKDMSKLAQFITGNQLVLSIMAGVSISTIQDFLPNAKKIIRVMPNTPALVGEAMSVLAKSNDVTTEELQIAKEIFESIGQVEVLPETALDAVTGLSGSGPAFVMMFIEALTQGGILCGLTKNTAEKLAIQTVLGSAKMASQTDTSVEQLRHAVTSPGGTTIAGVAALEENNFRNSVIKAVRAACLRSEELGKS